MTRMDAVVTRPNISLMQLGDRLHWEIKGVNEMVRFDSFPEQMMAFFMMGFPLVGLLLLAVVGGYVWRRAWGWIDDAEPGRNPVLELLARLRGWTPYTTEGNRYLWWKNAKGETETDVLFWFAFAVFAIPEAVFLSVNLYPVLLTGLTLMLVAYVARFARRHKKLFDKHLKDPEAHRLD